MKAEINDRQRTVAFLNSCVDNMSAEPTQVASKAALMQRFVDIMLQYEATVNEVNGRNNVLATLLPQFEEFSKNVKSLGDWVDLQMARMIQLQVSVCEATEDDWKVTYIISLLHTSNCSC